MSSEQPRMNWTKLSIVASATMAAALTRYGNLKQTQ